MNLAMKRNILFLLSMLIFFSGVLSPAFVGYADEEYNTTYSDAEVNFNEQSTKYLEGITEAKDIVRLMEEDNESNPNPPRDSMSYVMKRLFYPGVYVNDVRDAVIAEELEVTKSELLFDGGKACGNGMPTNLISHNCNIPNFTTGIIQNLVDPFSSPTSNAEKTSSYSDFGLGVPNDIPGGVVPVNPSSRAHTYTALELFGYDLKLTSYNGEWDNIQVSNESRMLSNFGIMDRINLIGTSLWNSVSSGIATYVEGFSFNPVRWFNNLGRSFEAFASAGVNTVVDTSELNVIATNAWKRPRLDNTLYNVYVMTDAEVIRETYLNYFAKFNDKFNLNTNEDERLNEVVSLGPSNLSKVTGFSYDPQMETEESKQRRAAAEAAAAADIAHNQAEQLKASHSEEPYTANTRPVTSVPEPVYYTEQEQMGMWYSNNPDVKKFVDNAMDDGLISENPGGYATYESMIAEWEKNYDPFFKQHFNAVSQTVTEVLEKTDSEVFIDNPHLDPKQSISKYACANPDGSMMRKSDGTAEYLYLANNTKTGESLNPKCAPARKPIGAGLLGHGHDNPEITDTRHISNVADDSTVLGVKPISGLASSIMAANATIAKITNVIINLSFSPLMEELGITTIVEKFIEGFRDTVFFPLATIFASVGALMLFFQVIRTGSIIKIFGSLFVTILMFVSGTVFLLYPGSTMAVIDKFPTYLDNLLAETILIDDDGSSYCSTGESGDGIRSAQCNVWGAMVFEPWTHLQFGTGYENLYANGKAPSGGSSFTNTNGSLVGDAAVNMGGGVVVNNWALYQLQVTKAGTINAKDNSGKIGVVDKNFYRLVDLQAGPNNGSGTDSRYFKVWSGQEKPNGLVALTLFQALALAIAIGGIGLAKIEVTFMFALSMVLLPIMLLAALIPQAQPKFKGYIANLISLLIRKAFLVILLAVLLRIITQVYSSADSITSASVISILVSVAFIMYRKEIMDIVGSNSVGAGMFGSNPSQLREQIANAMPNSIKQKYSMIKSDLKGTTAGFVGGAIGATEQSVAIRRERSSISRELRKIEREIAKGNGSEQILARQEELYEEKKNIDYAIAKRRTLSTKSIASLQNESNKILLKIKENELKIKQLINEDSEKNGAQIAELSKLNETLEEKREEISILAAGGERRSKGIVAQALAGSVHSRTLIGRSTERKLRTQGFSGLSARNDIRDAVFAQGAKDIASKKESLEYDTYKEILSKTKKAASQDLGANLNDQQRGELESPKIQRQIRKLAEERRKIAQGVENKDPRQDGIYTKEDLEAYEKAAKEVDKKRKYQTAKDVILRPLEVKESMMKEKAAKEEMKMNDSRVANIVEQIEEHLENDGYTTKTSEGDSIVGDKEIKVQKNQRPETNEEKINKELQIALEEIQNEINEAERAYREKFIKEREKLDEFL